MISLLIAAAVAASPSPAAPAHRMTCAEVRATNKIDDSYVCKERPDGGIDLNGQTYVSPAILGPYGPAVESVPNVQLDLKDTGAIRRGDDTIVPITMNTRPQPKAGERVVSQQCVYLAVAIAGTQDWRLEAAGRVPAGCEVARFADMVAWSRFLHDEAEKAAVRQARRSFQGKHFQPKARRR